MAKEKKETTDFNEAEKMQKEGWNTVEMRGTGAERVYVLEREAPVKDKKEK